MATIDIQPIVDAIAAGVKQALEGIDIGGDQPIQLTESNKPREPFGTGHAGWGAPGAPVVFEVYGADGNPTAIWGMAGNVLWKVDEVGGITEANGWHRVRISERQMFFLYIRYCQITRMDGDMKAYQYDKPLGT